MAVGVTNSLLLIGIVHGHRRLWPFMPGPFDGMKVIGFDLETTGFDCRSERIVEYAMVGSDSDGKHISLCSMVDPCLLYTSPSPRDLSTSRMPSSA